MSAAKPSSRQYHDTVDYRRVACFCAVIAWLAFTGLMATGVAFWTAAFWASLATTIAFLVLDFLGYMYYRQDQAQRRINATDPK